VKRFDAFLIAASAMALQCMSPAAAQEQKPNIVFMMVDNFGYGDLGVYGGGAVRGMPTPRIDALAAEGMRLTNFNVEAECTPTRSALMTGRMPIRSGTSRVPLPGLPQGLVPWEYTIAELLRDAGYQSAMYVWQVAPRRQGGAVPNQLGLRRVVRIPALDVRNPRQHTAGLCGGTRTQSGPGGRQSRRAIQTRGRL